MLISPSSPEQPASSTETRPADPLTATPSPGPLRLRLSYPEPRLAVLTVAGELDAATTPRMAALVWPRLQSALGGLVLDLHEVTFLGVPGLKLLASAHTYTGHRGLGFAVVNSTRIVDRALAAGGLETLLPCFATEAAARAAALQATTGSAPLRPA